MNQQEFANHIGMTPGYIAQLKNSGRLVMDGENVNVEASLQLINDTADPGRTSVANRHQQEREQKQSGAFIGETTDRAGSAYQQARAMREKYNAMQAKTAWEKDVGILLVADEVRLAVADGDAIIRNRLESLPDILAPQLAAERDEQKIRAMLTDQIEHLLSELSRSFLNLAEQKQRN